MSILSKLFRKETHTGHTMLVKDIYEVDRPHGWNVESQQEYGLIFYPPGSETIIPGENARTRLPVIPILLHIREPISSDGYSLYKRNLEMNMKNFEGCSPILVKEGNVRIRTDETAYYNILQWKTEHLKLQTLTAWVFRGWNAYQFTCDCTAKAFGSFEPLFMKTIETLCILREIRICEEDNLVRVSIYEMEAEFLKTQRVRGLFEACRPMHGPIHLIDFKFENGIELKNVPIKDEFLVMIPAEYASLPVETASIPVRERQRAHAPMTATLPPNVKPEMS
jgi:hypothetical protein